MNQAQQIAVSTTLLHLEQALDDIEQLLAAPAAGATYTVQQDFQPDTVWHIRAQCHQIRLALAETMAFFELPPHTRHIRRIISAGMIVARSNLEDIHPSRLHRYGAVDPALPNTLEPHLQRLTQLVQTLQMLAGRVE